MSAIKPKEDRLKETIRLLHKLKDVGLFANDKQLYQQIQLVMTRWVRVDQMAVPLAFEQL